MPISRTSGDRDGLHENLAAELALAAYRVVLGTRTQGTWLDLELDLWRALAETVETHADGTVLQPEPVPERLPRTWS